MSSIHIPEIQRAYVLPSPGAPLQYTTTHPVPGRNPTLGGGESGLELGPGECLVRLTHTGVCHTDLGIARGQYPAPVKKDLVGGHEGVGVVVALGASGESGEVSIGTRVGVKFLGDSCLRCEMCRKAFECHCPHLKATGVNVDGTFAEYVRTSVYHVTPIPESLDGPTAAAIMCAGVTVYSALRQAEVHSGDWVVVVGAGGGLGHLAIQYAKAMGLHVVGVDTGAEKRKLALDVGVDMFFDFADYTSSAPSAEDSMATNPNAAASATPANGAALDLASAIRGATHGGAHAALVVAGGASAYAAALGLPGYLRPKGVVMAVGVPGGKPVEVNIMGMIAMGTSVKGVFLGNRQDAQEAVNIAAAGKVRCSYSLRKFSELEQVFEEMEQGKVVGRVVLEIGEGNQ